MEIEIPSCKLGVAVSGGMDSMALLFLYLKSGSKPAVINVEHGIRGENSLRDSEFVRNFCLEHGLKLFFKRVDSPRYAEKHKMSEELAARTLRYEFFKELTASGEVDKIALAHHADDNAETILMREFRGTGIRGLKGVSERDEFLRPLLKYTREEIREFVAENNIPHIEDETNDDDRYTRNYIRNRILPLIKERYPSAVKSLSRLAENAAECDDFISSFMIPPKKTRYGVILENLYKVHDIVKKYSVHAALREMGIYKDVEYCHLKGILDLRENNSSTDLPFDITATRHFDDLALEIKSDETFTPTEFSPEIEISYRGYRYIFTPTDKMEAGVTFDLDKAKGAVIRERADGDRFRHVNGRDKLLSDYLNDKKAPKSEKAVLVMARGNRILAILGMEVSEEIKIDNTTEKIIKILKEKTAL